MLLDNNGDARSSPLVAMHPCWIFMYACKCRRKSQALLPESGYTVTLLHSKLCSQSWPTVAPIGKFVLVASTLSESCIEGGPDIEANLPRFASCSCVCARLPVCVHRIAACYRITGWALSRSCVQVGSRCRVLPWR
eukprot:5165856-Amphidinium_carterae.1